MQTAKSEKQINLRVPYLLPCNGRLVLQATSKEDYVTKSNIIIPVNFDLFNQRKSNKEEAETKSPYAGYDFYIVAMAPEVQEQMRLQHGRVPEAGDKAIVSERFTPILYREESELYFLIHWQDLLGIIKNNIPHPKQDIN